MKIGIIGAGMMGSSLFYACKNIHEPILIAKESMHLKVENMAEAGLYGPADGRTSTIPRRILIRTKPR